MQISKYAKYAVIHTFPLSGILLFANYLPGVVTGDRLG